MTSRRSRLKASANIPIRRKPSSKEPNTELRLGNSADKIICAESTDDIPQQKLTTAQTSETISVEQNETPETSPVIFSTNDTALPPTSGSIDSDNTCINKSDKVVNQTKSGNEAAPIPIRFGRRVKPLVCLPLRKEKVHSDLHISNEIKEKGAEEIGSVITQEKSLEDIIKDDVIQSQGNQETSQVIDDGQLKQNLSNPIFATPGSNKLSDQSLQSSPAKSPIRTIRQYVNMDVQDRSELNDVHKSVIASPPIRHVSGSSATPRTFAQCPTGDRGVSQMTDFRKHTLGTSKRKRSTNDLNKKMEDYRKKFNQDHAKNVPERSQLKMIDLIFYNPPKVQESKDESKETRFRNAILNEESEDDPDIVSTSQTRKLVDAPSNEDFNNDNSERKEPVPRVKIGPDGEVILDEKSLVIETTEAKKGREDLQNSLPVFEDGKSRTSYYSRRTQKTKAWTNSETERFYIALQGIGTDFMTMEQLFPLRTRQELKNKFKREEKMHLDLVDKALKNCVEFDVEKLKEKLELHRKAEADQLQLQKQQQETKAKNPQRKFGRGESLLSKEMVESDGEGSDVQSQSELMRRPKNVEKEKIKKQNEIDMVYSKIVPRDNTAAATVDEKTVELPKRNDFAVEGPHEENNPNKNNLGHVSKKNFNSRKKESEFSLTNESHGAVDKIENVAVLTSETEINLINKSDTGEPPAPVQSDGKNRKRKWKPEVRKTKKREIRESIIYRPDIEEEGSDIREDSSHPPDDDPVKHRILTKLITDQDLYRLLSANGKNLNETTLQVQVTEQYSEKTKRPERTIEVIVDNVPPITINELQNQNVTILADCDSNICEGSETECLRKEKEASARVSNEYQCMMAEEQTVEEAVLSPFSCSSPISENADDGCEHYEITETGGIRETSVRRVIAVPEPSCTQTLENQVLFVYPRPNQMI